MMVSEVMTTDLVTVTPDDTLGHAANLLRQHQFHHLPVIKASSTVRTWPTHPPAQSSKPVLEGLITSQDIDIATVIDAQSSGNVPRKPWQEQRVAALMHPASITVTPTTSVAAAAQILVERGINCVPVLEYEGIAQGEESSALLVGLLTRSDILLAMARSLGAIEPGMQLCIALPPGDMTPLADVLRLARELHIKVQSVLAVPQKGNIPRIATVRLGTIHPTPLLLRLQKANINYTLADDALEGGSHV